MNGGDGIEEAYSGTAQKNGDIFRKNFLSYLDEGALRKSLPTQVCLLPAGHVPMAEKLAFITVSHVPFSCLPEDTTVCAYHQAGCPAKKRRR